MSRARLGLLALAAVALLGVDRPSGLGDVVEVRHWSYDDYTRVVVELTRPVETELKRLPPDPDARRPERLYLDLPGIWVGLRYREPIPIRDGLLRGVRVGQNTEQRTRVVLDLAHYGRHRVFRLTSPHRVVVDVYGEDGPAARRGSDGRAGRMGPEAPRRQGEHLPVELRTVETVVIDAGHGGGDPGAVGVGGLQEKEVTLGIARELRGRLEDRGFQVVMTRSGDQTLDLEERTALADGAGGDVFVSIHANAAPRRGAHGIETYYLDRGHERHTLRVAARENGVAPTELDELQRTLAGLRVTEMSRHSALLARSVHERLLTGVRSDAGGARDLGVKRGPFHVLFLSNMPSILVEVGFLTNGAEARRLQSSYYRKVVAEHLARGLSRYRSAHRGLRVAGGRP